VIPILLACWLRNFHVQPLFLKCFKDLLIDDGILAFELYNDDAAAISWIVRAYALAAKSNSVLAADEVNASENVIEVIKEGRKAFQRLFRAAADSVNANARSRSQTPSQLLENRTSESRLLSAADLKSREATNKDKKRAGDYRNGAARPNVHTALHYDAIAHEYLLPVHCNVLIGEDKTSVCPFMNSTMIYNDY
jgi:hypothetical protein